jgi:hypothetical protein
MGTSSIDWTQLSRFYLKTETESSLRNVILNKKQDDVLNENTTMNMSRNVIFVLMCHRHKLFEDLYKLLFYLYFNLVM